MIEAGAVRLAELDIAGVELGREYLPKKISIVAEDHTTVHHEKIIEAVKSFRNKVRDAATTILMGHGTPKKKEAAFLKQVFELTRRAPPWSIQSFGSL